MRWRGWLVVGLLTAAGAAEAQQGPSVVRQIRENQQRLDSIRREREGLEGELQQRCMTSDDFREGVSAFFEKRPAQFAGR